MTPAAILNALHQPMTFAELRADLLGTAHNGTMSDDRKLSATLWALRKQGAWNCATSADGCGGARHGQRLPLRRAPM